jgi:hypothetical protein
VHNFAYTVVYFTLLCSLTQPDGLLKSRICNLGFVSNYELCLHRHAPENYKSH